jgi:hypothetical protein
MQLTKHHNQPICQDEMIKFLDESYVKLSTLKNEHIEVK